jgi:hypothetical protein
LPGRKSLRHYAIFLSYDCNAGKRNLLLFFCVILWRSYLEVVLGLIERSAGSGEIGGTLKNLANSFWPGFTLMGD